MSELELKIYQIYYQSWQKDLLDPLAIPFDNSGRKSELLEFDVFERISSHELSQKTPYWGALSWRFMEKTGLTIKALKHQIATHPGYDLYYCNPEPRYEALFHNLWQQGEVAHPNFLELSKAFFEVNGLPIEDLISITPSAQYSATNSFVASPQFWQSYLPWINACLNRANQALAPRWRDLLHSSLADFQGLHKGASYVPFIVERLLMVFLKTSGHGLTAHALSLPKRVESLNVHLKTLRLLKEQAHQERSSWLANCWVNYRNLYLNHVQDQVWCDRYLTRINPQVIVFSEDYPRLK